MKYHCRITDEAKLQNKEDDNWSGKYDVEYKYP
jgi:hypothetical protein